MVVIIKMDENLHASRIKQKTVVEQIVKEIKDIIANGINQHDYRFPTELELTERFGVSRTAVREAVKTLNYLGILESHTSRGTRINKKSRFVEEAVSWAVTLSCEDMYEIFVLGTALDTQVAIIVINRIGMNDSEISSSIREVDEVVKDLNDAAKEGNLEKFMVAFSDFFRLFYEISTNTIFISLNECINSLITKKVCCAYFETQNLIAAAWHLSSIWNSTKSGSLVNSINDIQEYGRFAYNAYQSFEGLQTP